MAPAAKNQSALGVGVETMAMSNGGKGNTPTPDPTILTTQQLLRELGSAREILEARIEGIEKSLQVRLDAQKDRMDGIQSVVDHRQAAIDAKVGQLQELHEEKFHSIETQFRERDTRTEQTSRDSKVAVDAALQAAKEAVGEQNKSSALAIAKSEAATTKQIDQQGILIQTTTGGLNDKIDDLKTRLTSIEGRTKGIGDGWGYVIGGVGLIATVLAIVGGIAALLASRGP